MESGAGAFTFLISRLVASVGLWRCRRCRCSASGTTLGLVDQRAAYTAGLNVRSEYAAKIYRNGV